jgi:hypothetical protein
MQLTYYCFVSDSVIMHRLYICDKKGKEIIMSGKLGDMGQASGFHDFKGSNILPLIQ